MLSTGNEHTRGASAPDGGKSVNVKRVLAGLAAAIVPLMSMAVVQASAAQAMPIESAKSSAQVMIPPDCHRQARQDLPVHSRPNRDSSKIGWVHLGQRITVTGCRSTTAGSYTRCGGGNSWYLWGGGYIATKCFRNVD